MSKKMVMKLSDIPSVLSFNIHKDSEFGSIGLITHDKPQMLTYLESEKFLPRFLQNSQISSVVTTPSLIEFIPEGCGIALSDNPRKDFFLFHNHLAARTDFYWKSFPSRISDKAIIHLSAFIADNDVVIEDDVLIEPNVTILERVMIESGSIIRAGATLGAEGFEMKRFGDEVISLKHAGGVQIGKRVEIQCNSNVDRSVYGGFTIIGDDTKIDTLVHIGHHVIIGKRCFIAATTVVSGSSVIGDDVWVGPGCTISNEIMIGNNAIISLGSVVTRDVEHGQHVTGNFAIEHKKFIAFMKTIR
jgi:UDP-3-O-[3-hydroxymyristoyl] glucosamine N-acyltransferase